MGEKGKQSSSQSVLRKETELKKQRQWNQVVVGGLLATYGLGDFCAQDAAKSMSRFMSTTKGHRDAWGLIYHLWPWCCLRIVSLLQPCQGEWPGLKPGVMVSSDLSCYQETCLSLWPYITQGLSCYIWLLLPPRAEGISRVCSST